VRLGCPIGRDEPERVTTNAQKTFQDGQAVLVAELRDPKTVGGPVNQGIQDWSLLAQDLVLTRRPTPRIESTPVSNAARTGRVSETASMVSDYAQSDQFRGARIHLCNLAGLEIRDCEVNGLKIVDCYGSDVYLGGYFERLVVNDVDVTAYVEAELDRRHPARSLARDAASPEDYRAAWDAIETLWDATLDRARLLPEPKLHERVDDEWSLVETHRHLLFACDAWLGNAVLEEEAPYHPLGLPARGTPPEEAAKLGLALDATPTLDEVLAPRLARMATMRRVVDGLTAAELDRVSGRKPADMYPDQEYVVRRCLKVVLKEEAEHHRYAMRDLAVLEAGVPEPQ
jgi:hypothetical protein